MKSNDTQASAIAVDGEDGNRDERIRARAYELYLDRGMEPGHEVADWLQAEQEVLSQTQPLTRRIAA